MGLFGKIFFYDYEEYIFIVVKNGFKDIWMNAIAYRIKSHIATQFRIWATKHDFVRYNTDNKSDIQKI